MVTVPTNCPEGQQLVNGVCRDIWQFHPIDQHIKDNAPLNMITVPQNCPPGQELVNGVCREIWRNLPTSPLPPIAEETNFFEELIKRFQYTMYEREKRQVDFVAEEMLALLDKVNTDRNIISVPNQCPIGYKPDILGICRPIFD
ncbi:unnamed protein product, partial [Iphiclides podalirius]